MSSLIESYIAKIEEYAVKNAILHRFVGGVSYAGLLNKKTIYTINLKKRTITLKHHNQLQDFRKDGSIKDIDIIVLNSEQDKLQRFQTFISKMEHDLYEKKKYIIPISVENAIYPFKGERNWITQFVTAIEVLKPTKTGEWQPYLTFEDLRQEISWDSLEDWHVILENGLTFTTRNPVGDYYAYFFRTPGGIKLKDLHKINELKKLADTVIKLGKAQRPIIDFHGPEYYGPWNEYISKLSQSSSWSIRLKSVAMKAYWNTIGTDLAHGKGIGKLLSRFATQFTGVKQ